MNLELAGRTAIVTGASKGIGYGIAETLAKEGCSVHMVARSAETLDQAASTLRAATNANVESHIADLSHSNTIDAILKKTGIPDILVNNAGAVPGGNLDAVNEVRWREAWELKVFGYINFARAVYAEMRKRRSGVILNVTGMAADRTDFSYIAGTTGNAALNAFSRALGSFSLEDGIRVLAISPGPVETERLATLMKTLTKAESGSHDGWRKHFSALPASRAAAVSEIADVAAFLVSDRASYMSGTVVTVDGGHSTRGGTHST